MDLKKAIDEFMFYLEVEKNCSHNTLRSYAFDLRVFEMFIRRMYDSKNLDDLCVSSTRRFIQDQVITFLAKPRTLQRKISCMKTFS